MKTAVSSSRALASSLVLAASCASFAQSPALKPVVVTATRSAAAADELVGDVSVLDRSAIQASTARTLPELLARLPGIQMTSHGGLGKASNVFIRGSESRHTLLLVDGVRLGSATLGTPSWDNIPLDMIERIEVLKGPASALYGSDAVGGVVQVFLRKGRAGFHPSASLTVGSRGHARAVAGLQAGQGPLSYSLGVQRVRERGFSATNSKAPFGNHNPDRDRFEQDAFNASGRYEINKAWSVDAGLLYADGISAFDDGASRDSRLKLRDVTAHAGVRGELTQEWQTELRLSEGRDTSNTIEASFPGAFRTRQSQWTWQNHAETPLGRALAGVEQRVQQVSGTTAYSVTRRTIDSVFAGLNGSEGSHSWQANLRHDNNSQFGSGNTGVVGYGHRVTPTWRVHASHGTSFVAPSFNQLYFPNFGNPALQPERGRNTDVGVSWSAAGHELKLVRFDNRIRGFITSTTAPANVPKARIDGWTLGYAGKLDALTLHASLDALDPRNELSGKQLPRRAKRQATVGSDHESGAWRFGASLLHVGERFDDAANARPLAAYTVADVYAHWQFAKDWSAQAKLNNLTNRQYETAHGYNQPARGVYLTLRWTPR